jgi:serine/threonine-protein kinase
MQDHLVGKKLREYLLLYCIGKGGMAKVYKARHTLLDEVRAIKILRSELADRDQFIARFHREAQILVRLRHPNLVMLHEFGTLGNDLLFIVMEFIKGESLRARLQHRGWLSVSEAVKLAKQVCQGLSAAHKEGVVHRDISPENILLAPKGDEDVVKIIDFGIAKNPVNFGGSKLTRTMEFVGKAEYCSPEQIEPPQDPNDFKIDGRADIYSLGVTLFEALTGELPFNAKTAPDYLAMHTRKPPKLIQDVNPMVEIPKGLQDLVMSTLEKDRDRRPQSAEELYQQLTALQHEELVLTTIW